MKQNERQELIKRVRQAIKGTGREKEAIEAAQQALDVWDKESGAITLYSLSSLISLVKTLRRTEKATSN